MVEGELEVEMVEFGRREFVVRFFMQITVGFGIFLYVFVFLLIYFINGFFVVVFVFINAEGVVNGMQFFILWIRGLVGRMDVK